MVSFGVVGDYNPANETHLATTAAIKHAAARAGVAAEVSWIPTDELRAGDELAARLAHDGLVISPGSPYRNMDGALAAIENAVHVPVCLLYTSDAADDLLCVDLGG